MGAHLRSCACCLHGPPVFGTALVPAQGGTRDGKRPGTRLAGAKAQPGADGPWCSRGNTGPAVPGPCGGRALQRPARHRDALASCRAWHGGREGGWPGVQEAGRAPGQDLQGAEPARSSGCAHPDHPARPDPVRRRRGEREKERGAGPGGGSPASRPRAPAPPARPRVGPPAALDVSGNFQQEVREARAPRPSAARPQEEEVSPWAGAQQGAARRRRRPRSPPPAAGPGPAEGPAPARPSPSPSPGPPGPALGKELPTHPLPGPRGRERGWGSRGPPRTHPAGRHAPPRSAPKRKRRQRGAEPRPRLWPSAPGPRSAPSPRAPDPAPRPRLHAPDRAAGLAPPRTEVPACAARAVAIRSAGSRSTCARAGTGIPRAPELAATRSSLPRGARGAHRLGHPHSASWGSGGPPGFPPASQCSPQPSEPVFGLPAGASNGPWWRWTPGELCGELKGSCLVFLAKHPFRLLRSCPVWCAFEL